MWSTRCLLKSPGAAICKDFPHARLITLSRSDVMNTMTVPMLRDLYKIYIKNPHPDPEAVYVLRGEGTKAFCAGGDIVALGDLDGHAAYREEYFAREYEVDLLIATGARTQVSLWQGHALGSGSAISMHSRYRVACETARVAMPETQIGALPDVGSVFRFQRLKLPGLGAYLAITGEALKGADLFHSGLATHYIPATAFPTVEESLVKVNKPNEVGPLLEEAMHQASKTVPAFTLSASMPLIEKAFGITQDTTIEGIMHELKSDGSPFARATLATMERNSPTAMVVTLENYRAQRELFGPKDIAKAMMADLRMVDEPQKFMSDFTIGPTALLKDKSGARPAWKPNTLAEVDQPTLQKAVRRVVEDCLKYDDNAMKGKGDFPM